MVVAADASFSIANQTMLNTYQKLFFPTQPPARENKFRCLANQNGYSSSSMETEEFSFTSTMPQRATRVGFFQGIKNFFDETGGGAIPIPLASKMIKRSPETIRAWIKKGKVRAFRTGATVLVNIHDLEDLLDEPVDKGGRPKKVKV